MKAHALISYMGPDKPTLISSIIMLLEELGGSFGDVTFATLGEAGELTFIYEMPDGLEVDALRDQLESLSVLQSGTVRVESFALKAEKGPTSRITHRIVLSGEDRSGLLKKIIDVLDKHGAVIVRMNAERLHGATTVRYAARIALSVREERAPDCLSDMARLAASLNMTLRYETA